MGVLSQLDSNKLQTKKSMVLLKPKKSVVLLKPSKRVVLLKPNGGHRKQNDDGEEAHPQESVGSSFEGVLFCNDIEEWSRPNCARFHGMIIPRPQSWGWIQDHIDTLAESGAFGPELSLQEVVHLSRFRRAPQRLEAELSQKAMRLVGLAVSSGLPPEMGRQVEQDFKQIGMVMSRMAPASKMFLKLDIMGTSTCSRWHQDQYTGRAVVSYNLCGTDYVDHEHVDFWELKNCGNNDCVVRDSSKVLAADVGDVLFMKGTKFPTVANGLVHRSPEKLFHANGNVMNRLLLKVDLP
jgi:hypothetical protein